MTDNNIDRLFVPLETEHYLNFENGLKDTELRGYSDRFNMRTVVPGRKVELRRGYSTPDSLYGRIGHVRVFEHISNISEKMDHTRILPGSTREEFEVSAKELLSDYNLYIAFSVSGLSSEGYDDG